MGFTKRLAALLLLTLAASCGSSGGDNGSGAGYNAGAAFGVVKLVSHSPQQDAVQVALDGVLQLEFDADMALETFADQDTWLRKKDSATDVPVTFTRGSNGRVACTPDSELDAETDYVFQLSALTSDLSGRILDVTTSIAFRTFDDTPPTVLSFDVASGAVSVSRTEPLTLQFNEVIDNTSITPESLYLRDVFGGRYAANATVAEQAIVLDPYSDLPGDRQMTLVVTTAVADRAGNRVATIFQSNFRTAADSTPPNVVGAWPELNESDVSPKVQPTFTFDESMDPATVEAVSLLFQDEFGSIIPFAIEATTDQRTLRVRPTVTLQENRSYTLAFLLGGAAATDVSGNSLSSTKARTFTTGTDSAAPQVVASSPTSGEGRVPGALVASVQYNEDLDPDWVHEGTVELLAAGKPWPAVIELIALRTIEVTPVLALPPATDCTLTIRGGQVGLHDPAGNVPPADHAIEFTTSADEELPEAMILPPDGSSSIALGSHISIVFDAPMDASTLTPATIQVRDAADAAVAGQLELNADNRVVTFTPSGQLLANADYSVRILSGNGGARRASGNWFDRDQESRFRTGPVLDGIPPAVSATINGIPIARREGLVVPPSGFSIDVNATDSSSQWTDMGSVEIQLTGGFGPTSQELLAAATIGYSSLVVIVPEDTPLAVGKWNMTVRVSDLSGNVGQSTSVAFEVDDPSGGSLPFERTQVVWIRTDLDRDGNGRRDFADDMLRLGFASEDDPIGSNAWLESVVVSGVLAKANSLYKRGSRGEPLDEGSVQLRLTPREPIALPHMQMALGGLDPEGDRNRAYGAESTGVLGRAYYDYRNGDPAERNTGTSPGLGVFPAEMWLYQTNIHNQVYPSFQTLFASKFLPICPAMGGTPAGSHPLDATVLTPTFDYESANSSERARWNTVMAAADDWVAVIGVIMAHEIGHSVGLVAPGAMPNGLFGDSSLHDTYASAAEVMAPSVGYEAMSSLEYEFRDIDLAYLRQRVLLR